MKHFTNDQGSVVCGFPDSLSLPARRLAGFPEVLNSDVEQEEEHGFPFKTCFVFCFEQEKKVTFEDESKKDGKIPGASLKLTQFSSFH